MGVRYGVLTTLTLLDLQPDAIYISLVGTFFFAEWGLLIFIIFDHDFPSNLIFPTLPVCIR